MTSYSLSIQRLYETFGEKLAFGYITVEKCEGKDHYYDFHNRDGNLACCDGETAEILNKKDGVYTLHSDCALEDVPFSLTEDELNIAVIR